MHPHNNSDSASNNRPSSPSSSNGSQTKKRDREGIHYLQEIESNPQINFQESYLFDCVQFDVSDTIEKYQEIQRPEEDQILSAFLDMESPIEDHPEIIQEIISESQAESIAIGVVRVIKKRNRTRLSKSERRIFSNMIGFTIGAIKRQTNNYNFDGIQLDVQTALQIQQCFNLLKQVLRLISSKTGNRKHLGMLLNAFNQRLNQKIDARTKTRAQLLYLLLVEQYNPVILNQAKRLLRNSIFIRFSPRRIHFEAQGQRQFVGTPQQIRVKKQTFQKYLLGFRVQLGNHFILNTINRRTVLGYQLYPREG